MTSTLMTTALLRKRIATAKARAALDGIELHQIVNDTGSVEFIATRWSLTKAFDSLDALETWLDTVTGQTAKDLYA